MTFEKDRLQDSTDKLVRASSDLAASLSWLVKSAVYEWDSLRWQWRKAEHRFGLVEHKLQRPANDVVRAARRFAGELHRSYLRTLTALR